MVDVNHKRKFLKENCMKQPCFNFDSETKGIQCAQHKKKNIVDKKNKKKCNEENFINKT